jgi:hypothetical protein
MKMTMNSRCNQCRYRGPLSDKILRAAMRRPSINSRFPSSGTVFDNGARSEKAPFDKRTGPRTESRDWPTGIGRRRTLLKGG